MTNQHSDNQEISPQTQKAVFEPDFPDELLLSFINNQLDPITEEEVREAIQTREDVNTRFLALTDRIAEMQSPAFEPLRKLAEKMALNLADYFPEIRDLYQREKSISTARHGYEKLFQKAVDEEVKMAASAGAAEPEIKTDEASIMFVEEENEKGFNLIVNRQDFLGRNIMFSLGSVSVQAVLEKHGNKSEAFFAWSDENTAELRSFVSKSKESPSVYFSLV